MIKYNWIFLHHFRPARLNIVRAGDGGKKTAGYSHRTAQPPTLAAFRPWEGSAGAGRVRPAAANIGIMKLCKRIV
jgi:hypothetical protein